MSAYLGICNPGEKLSLQHGVASCYLFVLAWMTEISGAVWEDDIERSGVENADFLLGIDENSLKFVSGLGAVKSSCSNSSTLNCAGWVLCCGDGLVTDVSFCSM